MRAATNHKIVLSQPYQKLLEKILEDILSFRKAHIDSSYKITRASAAPLGTIYV